MKKKRVAPTKVIGTLMVFVGLSPDHHKVLCIEKDGRLSIPTTVVPEGTHPDNAAFDLKAAFIEDENPRRSGEDAYHALRLPRGIVRVFIHAEVIDGQCWMKCPYRGIWMPYRHLLDPDTQPAEVCEALHVLAHRHWHEEALTALKRERHLI
jgi:hypothetical protein